MIYEKFLEQKGFADQPDGLTEIPELNSGLFDFQADIVRWSLRRGRAAVFAGTGMGKTLIQLECAKHIPGRVLIVAPLAVADQTVREAEKFGIDGAKYLRTDDGTTPIAVTNYEMLHCFSPGDFNGIVLDEASILKDYTGKFRNYVIQTWGHLPFRASLTATPAPNDVMELANQAEFLGVMTRSDMLAHFFVHDGGSTQKWRLKGHAETEFWKWLCSWAVMLRKPSDLGYPDGDFLLPPLDVHQVNVECQRPMDGFLFAMEAQGLQEQQAARRSSIEPRAEAVAGMVNDSTEPWGIWCDLNGESSALARMIPDAVEVRGSDKMEVKCERILGFAEGKYRVLVSKPSICGQGMNFQHCSHTAFTGLSNSWEKYFQAVRRFWRFGQKNPVHAYIATTDAEGAVVRNIERKEADAERMADEMIKHMQDITSAEIRGVTRMSRDYRASKPITIPNFLNAAS